MTEFLAREMPGAGLTFASPANGVLTFQDPCRLGRLAGIYDPPRDLLKLLPEAELKEMERSRENALCCGTSAWMECSSCSKAMQMDRLEEARRTGAQTLVTACPKCQIHLSCAQSNTDMDLKIVDLYAYLLDHLVRS
jgi:Fe-S oxidoreductase